MKKRYRQTKKFSWLDTPTDTIWIETTGSYIQPEDTKLRETPLGVNLQLLSDEDYDSFQLIKP